MSRVTGAARQALEAAIKQTLEAQGLEADAGAVAVALNALVGTGESDEGEAERGKQAPYDPVADGQQRAAKQRGHKADPDSLAWR